MAYRERLTPSVGVWAAASILPIGLAVCMAPFGPRISLIVLLVVGVATLAGLRSSTATVAVTDDPASPTLVAGRAKIPCALLGSVEVFSGEGAHLQRGTSLDMRAYVLLRGWIDGMVKVHLTDPNDPTPYWLISSRRPHELADAIRLAGLR